MNAEPSLRETLVRAGVEVLEQVGTIGLSLRAITRRAGVSHGAPRRYFPTHNALLAAIAATGFTDLLDDLGPILADVDAPATDRLVGLGTAYVRFAQRRPAMFELMFRHDLLEGAGSNLRETSLPMFDTLAGLVAEAAGAGARARAARDEHEMRQLALGLWTNLHGTAVLAANRSLHLVAGQSHVAALLDLPNLVTRAVHTHTR